MVRAHLTILSRKQQMPAQPRNYVCMVPTFYGVYVDVFLVSGYASYRGRKWLIKSTGMSEWAKMHPEGDCTGACFGT